MRSVIASPSPVLPWGPAAWGPRTNSSNGVGKRSSGMPGRERLEETRIPLVIVSPSCDVFYLGRRDGRLITTVELLLLEGYDRAGEIRFHAAAREDLTVSLDTDELTISPLFLDEYSIDVREGFADMLDVAGGLLLAITHEPIGALAAGEGDAAELERVITSRRSAFAWIPAESIQKG